MVFTLTMPAKRILYDTVQRQAARVRKWRDTHRGLHNANQRAYRRRQRIAKLVADIQAGAVRLSP